MPGTFESRLKRILKEKPRKSQRGWGCLSESDLAAFAEGKVAIQERKRIEPHLERCSYCREQAAFAVRAHEESQQPVPEAWLTRARKLASPGGRVAAHSPWRWAAAAAVCLVLVSIIAVYTPRQGTQTQGPNIPAAVRGESNAASSPELISPAPGTIVPTQGTAFRWNPVPGARRYKISVVTGSGDLVWQGSSHATSAKLPTDVHLAAGQKYFVWIRAYFEDGKSVRSRAAPLTAGNLQ